MFDELKNIETSKENLKGFGVTIGIILLAVSATLFIYKNGFYFHLALIGFSFISIGLFLSALLKPIYIIWMIFSLILGWIMTRIILSIIFYFIMTPIGLITRALGEDFLALKKVEHDSYWNIRDSISKKNQDYEKQF